MPRVSTAVVVDADDEPRTPRLERRYYGYFLLAVALLATLCVPGLVGRRLVGSAVAAPAAPPPTVGQCRDQIQRPEDLDRLTGTALVPCERPHSAEVVSIGEFAADQAYPETAEPDALMAPKRACAQQAYQFVGLAAVPATDASDPSTVPHMTPQLSPEVVVPTRHQWKSGQRWYACQIRPAGNDLPIGYLGTARMAAVDGIPAPFARCAQVIGGPAVPCQEPHYAEQLSAAVPIHGGVPLDCPMVAARIIGSPDPSFGSALSLTAWQASGGRVACWATSTTGVPFVGTLIGLGDNPLPTQ
jgi:hypothetical protein